MDAGGAAVLAGTVGGDFPGAPQQVFQNLEGPGRQPHPAGVAVVDEDGGPAYLGVRRMGDAPDVIAVRQGKERKHADEDVLQGVDAAHEVSPGGVNGVFDGIGDFQPHTHGFEDLGRQLQGYRSHKLLPGQTPLLVGQDMFGDLEAADVRGEDGRLAGLQDLQDLRLLVRLDAGEVVGLNGIYPNIAPLQIQAFHPPGLGLVEIDRSGVALPQGPVPVDGAQGPFLAGLEDGEAFP